MRDKMTLPPERELIEREIAELFHNGDLSDIARLLQKDYSSVSREFNPFEETRHNTVFQFILRLWAFDSLRDGLGDDVLAIVIRERDKWTSKRAVVKSHAKLTGKVGKEFCEAIETEIAGESFDKQISEWCDVERAAREKKQAVIAERNAKHFGVDLRTMAKNAIDERRKVA